MSEFVSEALMRTRSVPGVGSNLNVPVNTPDYQYLVCDLRTDELWAAPGFSNVRFERRLSRPGSFSGQLTISNRQQAQEADELSRNCGRLAVWVLRNKRLWWGGILWNAAPAVDARNADVVQFQGSSFESYPYRRHLDFDWAMDPATDMARKIMDIWNMMQSQDAESDIGVVANWSNVVNLANNFMPTRFLKSDLTYYGDMIEDYTDDPVAGVDYTIDVYHDADNNRVKQVKTAGDLKQVVSPAPIVISGYRIPSWGISRGTDDMGTNFQAWVNIQARNTAQAAAPAASIIKKAQTLLNEGWPRLDVREQIGDFDTWAEGTQYANTYAEMMRRKQSGIKDIVTYQVDLSGSAWHPNLIGQNVTVKHSQNDLWYPGETRVVAPVLAEFTPPTRTSPESVKFTFDNTREVFD